MQVFDVVDLPLELAGFAPNVTQGKYVELHGFWLSVDSCRVSDSTYKLIQFTSGQLVELLMHIAGDGLQNIVTSVYMRGGQKVWRSETVVPMPTSLETTAGKSLRTFHSLLALKAGCAETPPKPTLLQRIKQRSETTRRFREFLEYYEQLSEGERADFDGEFEQLKRRLELSLSE